MAERSKIEFTGVKLRSFMRKPSGGEANFQANFTQRVAQQMNWGDMRDFETGCQLEGELAAQTMTLCAKDSLMAGYEITIDISKVTAFQGVRREAEGKRGKGFRHDLYFKTKFVDAKACAFLEEYMCKTGDGRGSLVVAYTERLAQQQLPGTEVDAEAQQTITQ